MDTQMVGQLLGRCSSFLIFCIYLYICSLTDGQQVKLPIYTQHPDVNRFLYQERLPELTELTICFMLIAEENQPSSEGQLVSIATEEGSSNEFLIRIVSDYFIVVSGGAGYNLYPIEKRSMLENFLGWQKHCLAWKAEGSLSWYADYGKPGRFQLYTSHTFPSMSSVREGGALVMLNDQDAYLGDLDPSLQVLANITWINMWNYSMSAEEIMGVGCGAQGNLVNNDTLQMMGDPAYYDSLLCDEAVSSERISGSQDKQMNFCKLSDRRLANHVESTTTVSSPDVCTMLCLKSSICYSVNYHKPTGVCELNYVTDLESNLERGPKAVGYIHFTLQTCNQG